MPVLIAHRLGDRDLTLRINAKNECPLTTDFIALTATSSEPSVPFLKPTGDERLNSSRGAFVILWFEHQSQSGDRVLHVLW